MALRGIDLSLIKGKSWRVLIKLINKIDEQKAESRAWEVWLVKLPKMDKNNFQSFNDFYSSMNIKPPTETKEEVLEMVAKIRKAKGGENYRDF